MMITKLILFTTMIAIISSQQYSPLNSAQISELLIRHNLYRAMKCQAPLTWDPVAADVAYKYATACVYAHNADRSDQYIAAGYVCPNDQWSDCSYTLGENIAEGTTGYYSLSDFVDLWVGENKTFLPPSGSGCPLYGDGTCNCGHYTQVMWSSTFQVGCGLASCSGMDFLVCDYNVPGNFNPETTPVYPSQYCTAGPSSCEAVSNDGGAPTNVVNPTSSPVSNVNIPTFNVPNAPTSSNTPATGSSGTTILISIQVKVNAPLTTVQINNLAQGLGQIYETIPGITSISVSYSYNTSTKTYTFSISVGVTNGDYSSFQNQALATSTLNSAKSAVSQQTSNSGIIDSYIVNGSQDINNNNDSTSPSFIATHWWIFLIVGGVVALVIVVVAVYFVKKHAFKLAPNRIGATGAATLNTSDITINMNNIPNNSQNGGATTNTSDITINVNNTPNNVQHGQYGQYGGATLNTSDITINMNNTPNNGQNGQYGQYGQYGV